MSLRLGDTAPDFTAETSLGAVNFYDYLGVSARATPSFLV